MTAADSRNVKFRPEAELLLCLARLCPDEEAHERARALLQQNIDWNYLLQLSLRHKVMPLLYRQFNTDLAEAAPVRFIERLHDYFYLNATRNHLLTEELCEILRLFKSRGISAVTYKGPSLALDIYGDIALRQFSDLDIMVRMDDVAKASALLREREYRAEHELTSAQAAVFLKLECEHMFFREEGRVFLDLHWGFTPSYFPIELDAENIWKRLAPVALEKTEALTFSPEDLLLILSVNAGKEFWSQLVRLCDIAELLRTRPSLDWERLTREAQRAGARRMLFTSLRLARDLIGANIPEQVAESMTADRKVEHLAFLVRQKLFQDTEEAGGISHLLKPAKALDGLRARAKFHLRLALTPTAEDWTFIHWPERLRFLYYLTRPFRLVNKYLLRRRAPGN
jgi:Uncharacterised nucleotidyltransferase